MNKPNPPGRSNAGNNGDRNWRNWKKTSNNPNGNQQRPRINLDGNKQNPRNNYLNRNQQQLRKNPSNNDPYQHQLKKVCNNNRQRVSTDGCTSGYFNFHRLNELSKMNSDDVITTLTQKKTEFEELLNNITTPDLLVVTLRVLSNVCVANFAEIVTSVLSRACSASFLKNLEAYLTKLPFESSMEKLTNRLYYEDINRFWSNLIQFFKKVRELLPTKARDELTTILQKIHPIVKTIESSKEYKVDANIIDQVLNMSQELEEELKEIETKTVVQPKLSKMEENPPEDFRSLSVIPTVLDLFDPKPFIRPCKIKDAYDSVEHYLDVQFRLLREDFVSPLRNGIQEYLHGSSKFRSNEFRIYKKVTVIAPEISNNKLGVILSFGVLKYVNWRTSKRFMFGGLLLLSNDNFKSILFVTVADRDERRLAEGFIVVEPCPGTKITRALYNTNFVMLESKIYFEPYLVVLNAMQHMNAENFPMRNYLVNADTSRILPRYLEDGEKLRYKDWLLPIGADLPWPSAIELNLDETQYNAFKSALTQEFAIIQGPPGTGKTFIALEIVRTLLENEKNWKMHGPIVVVCLTNHALDQFLEGILQHTQSIVRIGNRSKSEVLKPYTLVARRNSMTTGRRTVAWDVMRAAKQELEDILSQIERTRLSIKLLTTPNALVPLYCLQQNCHDIALTRMDGNDELVNWLVGINITPVPKSSLPSQPPVTDNEAMSEETTENYEELQMDDELELNYRFRVDDSYRPIFPLQSMDAIIIRLNNKIFDHRHSAPELATLPFDPSLEWEEELHMLRQQRESLQRKLAQHPILNKQHRYRTNVRWQLYWTWVKFSYDNAINKTTELEKTYRHLQLKLDEAKQLVDLTVLRQHDIIGLTTNAAARLHASLRAVAAPIVLVEEAAEILEAHVVCSMTLACQHVILIGDHKQLRPKASVYKLGTKYNLNVSLFERMVNIRGHCTQLAHQHRMRPQIAKLICPSIYETLHNHDSVLNYPDVKGLKKNLFFLNHNNRETSHNNEESWVNPHEATFLIAFARHLILQGYNGSEITILCLYTGQLFALKKERDRYTTVLKQMRITTVDNYQGEENTIILLSLVRNNGEGNIGFLREENRVCVALSRAREGLYIMGNMDDLTTKNDIWPKIKQVLEDENAIGDSLELRCQIHADQSIQIRNATDFQNCPEGGCLRKCDADLSCGHSCTSICHILDREHEEFQCKQDCNKICINDHPCPLKCWMGCKPCQVIVERHLECGHTVNMSCSTDPNKFNCYIEVDAILPDCKHETKKPCSLPIENCKCPHPCENRLPCGHTCQLTCHVNADPEHIEYRCYKDCAKTNAGCVGNHSCKKRCHEKCDPCSVMVEKTRFCGHYYKMIKCSINPDEKQCWRACPRQLSCGHKCKEKCGEECGNCQETVTKVSTCGHKLNIKCCEEATPSKCNGLCKKKLACGHPCTAKCKDSCITSCKAMVRQTESGLCGHIFSVPCYLIAKIEPKSPELLNYCKEPCGTTLVCGHLCKGKCGTCKQGRIHVACGEPCGHTLVCGHPCDIPCRTACQPCNKPCNIRCRHNKCNKRCGMICTPCKEPCALGCKHAKCKKRCFELCDIKPCEEPCKKKLKCQHPCIGFCGDPCPPLCRMCDNEKLTEEFFLGDEDNPEARFVLLEDCSHCIEINGLLTWVSQEPDPSQSQAIQMKTCPRCKTPIRKCMRIANHVKMVQNDLDNVKRKTVGNQGHLKRQQQELLKTVLAIKEDPITAEFEELRILLQNLRNRNFPLKNQRWQNLNSQTVDAFRIVLELLQNILEILASIKNGKVNLYGFVKSQVVLLIKSLPTRGQISDQEINDITFEIRRLRYMAKFCNFDPNPPVMDLDKKYPAIVTKLLSVERFTESKALEIESLIETMAQSLQMRSEVIKAEQEMVRRAMNFTTGHWFKCPNDHIYAIGECGGATIESRCIECKAIVGGESHRLRSDNSVATEMDGATRPAWPGAYHEEGGENFPGFR